MYESLYEFFNNVRTTFLGRTSVLSLVSSAESAREYRRAKREKDYSDTRLESESFDACSLATDRHVDSR